MGPQTTNSHTSLGFSFEGFDWYAYIEYRPVYPPSFFSRIYDHHSAARPNNQFHTAHDEGAGAAIVSERLAEKFDHVILSEPNAQYLEIAEQRLSSIPKPYPEGKFSYLGEGAEKVSVPDGSVDLVTICEALHWTDRYATVAEAARQLKSGGSFCLIWYCPPKIADNDAAQAIWNEIFAKRGREDFKDPKMEIFRRASNSVASGYDNLGFDEEIWEPNVERWFTNCKGRSDGCAYPVGMNLEAGEYMVGERDKRVFVEDDRDWMTEGCDLEWLKQCASNFSPWMKISEEDWKELGDALGGKEVRVVWPNVQIIATKK